MHLSRLRGMDRTEKITYVTGVVTALVGLTAVIVISGWRHRQLTAYACDPFFTTKDNSECVRATSLTYLSGWGNWIVGVMEATALTLTVVTILMGVTYLAFGRLLKISGHGYRLNRRLHDRYLGVMSSAFVIDVCLVLLVGIIAAHSH